MVSPQILNQKQKKKYREWEIEPITSLAPGKISSRRVVAGRKIKPQYKSKPNTEHRSVYQKKKKKKIPNTQTKTKPSNPRTVMSPSSSPQWACRRRRRNGRPSSQIDICSQIDIDIVDGRLVIGSSLCRLRLCLCAS